MLMPERTPHWGVCWMHISIEIINHILSHHKNGCIAFSGGMDSMVLLDLVYRHTEYRPPVIFADSGMEYESTQDYVRDVCRKYNAPLHIAEAPNTYLNQWYRYGWPMLGKLAARQWMQRHRNFGYRLDVSTCCRRMKIAPARKLTRELGCTVQLTGQRGQVDDNLRGLRALKDGAVKYVIADNIVIGNPLIGWTDTMIKRYTRRNDLPMHPAKAAGAVTIGCLYCGGGAQYTNSGFKILRATQPEAWRKFMVDDRAGEIVLSIKYDRPLPEVRQAVGELGGLGKLADDRPWIFDYLKVTPIEGYTK